MHDENRLSPVLERSFRRAWLALVWATRGMRVLIPEPQMAQIEVTNRCNLTCRTCTRLKLPHLGEIEFGEFCRLVDALRSVRRVWLSGQGEPLLHPDLPRMIRYCVAKGVRETIVHTNGMLLTGTVAEGIAGSGLSELRVSIDGGTAEEMDYLRDGASLREILENVRSFVDRKSPTRTAFYTVLNRRNHTTAHLLPTLAASVGVKRIYMVETVPFRDESTEREIYDRREYQFTSLPAETRRSVLGDIRREAIRQMVDVRVDLKWYRKRCFEPFQKMYVDFQGNVTPCCRIHNEFFVGNILREGLEGSWYGGPMARWRRDILRSRDNRRICVERCNLGIGRDRRSEG
jgi:MoaA/NifB/PqqE/SkfB family radical SAM enzyme